MPWIALLWLVAASQNMRQTLMDEVYSIPASDWRYVPVVLKQPPVTLECEFHVISGGAGVRVGLVNAQALAAMKQGRRHDTLVTTSFEKSGRVRYEVLEPDEYAVIVDNSLDGRGTAQVQLRVSLDFPGRQQPQVRQLSPARRVGRGGDQSRDISGDCDVRGQETAGSLALETKDINPGQDTQSPIYRKMPSIRILVARSDNLVR